MTLYKSGSTCEPRNRCKKFKECEQCNRIRQAKMSDITELASRFSNRATYAVVMPHGKAQNQNTIKALKTKVTRKLRKSTDGMMVSVETSANDALHLNLIINSPGEISPRPFQTIIKNMGIEASIFVEDISKNDIRRVTSYAMKFQSLPSKEQYTGNLINLSGGVRNASDVIKSHRMGRYAPAVAVESMNLTLLEMGLEPPTEDMWLETSLVTKINKLNYMLAQLKQGDVCYHDEYGLLTKKKFEVMFKNTIENTFKEERSLKRLYDKPKKKRIWTTKKLPKGISLKEFMDRENGVNKTGNLS